jgi:hypothetical protein
MSAKRVPKSKKAAALLASCKQGSRGAKLVDLLPAKVRKELDELVAAWAAMPAHVRPSGSELYRVASAEYGARRGVKFPAKGAFQAWLNAAQKAGA